MPRTVNKTIIISRYNFIPIFISSQLYQKIILLSCNRRNASYAWATINYYFSVVPFYYVASPEISRRKIETNAPLKVGARRSANNRFTRTSSRLSRKLGRSLLSSRGTRMAMWTGVSNVGLPCRRVVAYMCTRCSILCLVLRVYTCDALSARSRIACHVQ